MTLSSVVKKAAAVTFGTAAALYLTGQVVYRSLGFADLPIDRIGARTMVNAGVEWFPDHLAGARLVEKENFPDATRLLIHIKQRHNTPQYETITLDDAVAYSIEDDDVLSVQQDIAKILDALQQNGLRNVYIEGFERHQELQEISTYVRSVGEEIAKREERAANARRDIRTLAAKLYDIRETFKLVKEADRLQVFTDDEAELFYKRIAAAATQLGETIKTTKQVEVLNDSYALFYRQHLEGFGTLTLTGRIEPHGIENSVMKSKGHQTGTPFNEYTMRGREDMVLQYLAEDRQRAAVVIYGGLHEFDNNVRRWNRANPDQRFALITITPTHYKDKKYRLIQLKYG